MKKRTEEKHEHVHNNFKVAVIAIFFFFLLFELHAPIFKPKITGSTYIDTLKTNERDSKCECNNGEVVESSCPAYCHCRDLWTGKIVYGRCVN